MTVQIRQLKDSDYAPIVWLAREWRDEVCLPDSLEWSDQGVARLIRRFAQHERGFGFVAADEDEVLGWIAGLLDVYPWDDRYTVGNCFCWYVAREYRNTKVSAALYGAFEGWCREKGCAYAALNLSITDDDSERQMRRLLRRKGFKLGLVQGYRRLDSVFLRSP